MKSPANAVPTRIRSELTQLLFDNRNLRVLPVDSDFLNVPRSVPNAIFSRVDPTPVSQPRLVAYSKSALKLLGLNNVDNFDANDENCIAMYFSGNAKLPGSETAAHCYCGHQFGSFAGQLGDGAAISLGEVINRSNNERHELQLKGAGSTPYSRSADGRKVLRSSIREFLCSEAMYNLHVPTTRAATLVTSDSTVMRDPFYDNNVVHEKCSIVSRIAANFFRFGSFEIFKENEDRAGPSKGNLQLKKLLLDHVLSNYYPDIQSGGYDEFFKEITKRTARLVARWQTTGFVHGVLNTDNMSIVGVTIDYGPFGFMEAFDEDYVPNGSDHSGRYSYTQQPSICKWNLLKLAEALHPFLDISAAKEILAETYDETFDAEYLLLMRNKLGLAQDANRSAVERDRTLIKQLFQVMEDSKSDFTDTFVALTSMAKSVAEGEKDFDRVKHLAIENIVSRAASPQAVVNFFQRKRRIHRLSMRPEQIQQLTKLLNQDESQIRAIFGEDVPLEVLREEVNGEFKKLDILTKAAKMSEEMQKLSVTNKQSRDRGLFVDWINRYFTVLMEQSSSGVSLSGKLQVMLESNPTIILRNWMAQKAIVAAESTDKENFEGVRELLSLLENPFNPAYNTFDDAATHTVIIPTEEVTNDIAAQQSSNTIHNAANRKLQEYLSKNSPEWADTLICTCSS